MALDLSLLVLNKVSQTFVAFEMCTAHKQSLLDEFYDF
jgi:hypothetical protein